MSDNSNKVDRVNQERATEQARDQLKPKDSKSKFDDAIEKQRFMQQTPNITKVNQESLAQEVFKEFSKKKEEKEEKKSDKKDDKKSEERDTVQKKDDAKTAEQKVIGKGSFKDGGGEGGGRGGQSGFGDERKSKKELDTKLKEVGAKDLPADLRSKFAQKLKQAMGPEHARLNQEIINKIIQFVKIRTNKLGEKEIELVLSEKIYRGLKLKVETKGKGKVAVHLKTNNSEAREALQRESESIKAAISKRGIQLDDIIIT